MQLRDRSAIITGASQGLGKAIATSFVQAGASVLLMARSEETVILSPAGTDAVSYAARSANSHHGAGTSLRPENCQAVVRYAQEALQNLTILVNNAGVSRSDGTDRGS